MSAIFGDASRILHPVSTPRPMSAGARKLRMPLSKTSPVKDRLAISYIVDNIGTQSARRGFASTVACNASTVPPESDQAIYPDLTCLEALPSLSQDDVDLDRRASKLSWCPQEAGIESWLSNVFDDHRGGEPKQLESPKNAQISLFGPCRFVHPLTPRGHLIDPSKRRKPPPSPSKFYALASKSQDFIINEDGPYDELAELSPNVVTHRKGKRPKRDRCLRYWNEGVLQENVDTPPNKETENSGRELFQELPSSTKAKGSMDGVEKAGFGFTVKP
ncbi:MAG: hypothetical protein Q9218_003643 [Villophora microphyllina]